MTLKNKYLSYLSIFILLIWLPALIPSTYSQSSRLFTDNDIKAAYLINFVRYIDWPDTTFQDKESPYVIAILGENTIEDILEKLIERTAKLKNRKLVYRHFDSTDKIEPCHILFIGSKEEDTYKKVREKIKNTPTLIVGDQEKFFFGFQHINFKIVSDTVKFEVSLATMKASNLEASAHLLRNADTVYENQ